MYEVQMNILGCFKAFIGEKDKIKQTGKIKDPWKVEDKPDLLNKTYIVGSEPCKSVKINVQPIHDDKGPDGGEFLKSSKKCKKRESSNHFQPYAKVLKKSEVPGSSKVAKCLPAVVSSSEVQKKAMVSVVDLKSISRSPTGSG